MSLLTDLAALAPWTLLAAFILGVVAVARFTRLVVDDAWPPMVWLRSRYLERTLDGHGWDKLVTCPFCFAPWPALLDLVWAVASGLDPAGWWGAGWWLANGWFAAAYLASMLVLRDEPPEEG